MTQFASGKLAFGFCDICGFRYNLNELKELTKRNKLVNIRACPECWNPDQPQNDLGSFPVDDPQAVEDPRPDRNLEEQRDYQYGWNPVGLNNGLALPDIEDDLEGTGQVGTVTVTTT